MVLANHRAAARRLDSRHPADIDALAGSRSAPHSLQPLSSGPVFFFFVVPITHAVHLRQRWGAPRSFTSLFFFPLSGGGRHAAFQVIGWALWGVSAAITLPVYLSLAELRNMWRAPEDRPRRWAPLGVPLPLIPSSHLEAAAGAAAVSSLWGAMFMFKALLVHDGSSKAARRGGVDPAAAPRAGEQGGEELRGAAGACEPGRRAAPGSGEQGLRGQEARGQRGPGQPLQPQLPPRLASLLVSLMGMLLAATGFVLLLALEHMPDTALPPRLASLLVSLMGMLLAATGFVLLLALEHMPDTASRVLYCCLALTCVSIGASSTHGLGGHLRYAASAAGSAGAAVLRGGGGGGGGGRAADAGDGSGGGSGSGSGAASGALSDSADDSSDGNATTAGAASAAGAGAGAASTDGEDGSDAGGAAAAAGGGRGGAGAARAARARAEAEAEAEPDQEAGEGPTWRFFQPFQGGSVFVATQVLGLSLLTFQNRRRARVLLQPVLRHPGASMARAAGLVLPVVMMYMPLHLACSSVAALFVLLPGRAACWVLAAVLLPYFAITLPGHPAHSGCRRWPWVCAWFSRNVEGSLAWWAGGLLVVRDFEGTAEEAADAAEREWASGQQEEEEAAQLEQQLQQQAAGGPPARRHASEAAAAAAAAGAAAAEGEPGASGAPEPGPEPDAHPVALEWEAGQEAGTEAAAAAAPAAASVGDASGAAGEEEAHHSAYRASAAAGKRCATMRCSSVAAWCTALSAGEPCGEGHRKARLQRKRISPL
ncbi:hypothetical protein TSOC_006723 [Tetrabaena socialis]|uniref:Uncharacterized protein n=1 Tax=Tetrabaena socialis TaxID=47790 RepID=A0A2J8A2Y6_9CHLO|nr:hypothetical protein TSOC_006723 [Tetrabaena socialis]|eukprot:PNH06876.1 hypothetical protein TSOC_006723 [Tetrabaena socialis]